MNLQPAWEHIHKQYASFIPDALSFYGDWEQTIRGQSRKGFMNDFFPLRLLEFNISSNDGLEKSAIELKKQLALHPPSSRIVLKVFFSFFRVNFL